MAGAVAAAQSPEQLKPQGYVSDFANVLSPAARAQLIDLCAEVDLKTQAQIAVVTVKTIGGRPIEDYSIDLATRWGIGPKQKDNGILILLAVDDHKYRFEVGYGLEGILPDGKVGGFGREAVPFLREKNYDAALLLMTRRVADVIAADHGVTLTAAAPPVGDRTYRGAEGRAQNKVLLLFGAVLFFFFIIRLLFGLAGGSSGYGRRGGGGWVGPMGGWGGGGFGGSGWHGGSGGGFGGFGGGSFGGGGASGSW